MLNIRPLHPSLQRKAIEELGEDPARIRKDLEAFRDWIKKSPHIKSRSDDQFLVSFLRGCKYSLERAKEKFDLYHTLKTHVPELTRNRDPLDEKVLAAIRQGVGISLPHLESPDGPRYFLLRPGCYDPNVFNVEDIMKVSTMRSDLSLSTDDSCIVSGQIGIIDFTGVSLSHLMKVTPTFIKKITMLQQDAAPIRQKATHIVNMPPFALTAFNIFQTFAKEKNKKRVNRKTRNHLLSTRSILVHRFSFMELTWGPYTK